MKSTVNLFSFIFLLTILSCINSCTIEKRVFRNGYSISWKHRLKGQKERQSTEQISENNTQASELDSLQIKRNSGIEEVKGVSVPTEILDSVSESISDEAAHETATESNQQARNEKTEGVNSKSNTIHYSGDRASNIFAGICVGVVMSFIIYAVIASGSIKFNPKTPTLTIALIVGVSILIIALILFGIIRAVIR